MTGWKPIPRLRTENWNRNTIFSLAARQPFSQDYRILPDKPAIINRSFCPRRESLMKRRWLTIALLLAASVGTPSSDPARERVAAADQPAKDSPVPSFQKDIQPLLKAKCWRCHGETVSKAELTLHTVAGIKREANRAPSSLPASRMKAACSKSCTKGRCRPTRRTR